MIEAVWFTMMIQRSGEKHMRMYVETSNPKNGFDDSFETCVLPKTWWVQSPSSRYAYFSDTSEPLQRAARRAAQTIRRM